MAAQDIQENNKGKIMGKYKKGDKFVIEIEETMRNETYGDFYKAKGLNGVYCEDFLDTLKMLKNEYDERERKEGYEDGLKDAFYAAKMIEFDIREGGINYSNLIKIFGFSSLKSIIFNFEPKEIVEKIKRFMECQEKFCVGDVVKHKNGNLKLVVTAIYEDGFDAIKVTPDDDKGKIFSAYTKPSFKDFEKTGEHFDLEKIFGLDKGE